MNWQNKIKISVRCSWIFILFCFFWKKKKNSNVLIEIFCALLELTHFDFLLCWWYIIKQILHAIFCLISKIFILGEVIFNFASCRWILRRVNYSKQTRHMLSMLDKYKVALFQAGINYISASKQKRMDKNNLQRQLC